MARILVIEDDRDVRDMLVQMLGRAGHEPLAASHGREGVDLAEQSSVDLVITDIVMPEQEGLTTLRHFRRMSPPVPVIAISGGGRIGAEEYLELAETMGASGVLAKPFSRDQLMDLVERCLVETA